MAADAGSMRRGAVDYPFRPAGNDRQPASRPSELAIGRWEALAPAPARGRARRRRRAREARAATADPATAAIALPLPGYEASFRVLSVHVAAGPAAVRRRRRRRRDCDARDSARAPLHRGRRRGDAAGVRVHRDQRARHGDEGDELDVGGPVTLRVRSNAPSRFTTMLWRDGAAARADHDEVDFTRAGAERARRLLGRDRRTGRAGPIAVDHEQPDLRRRTVPATPHAPTSRVTRVAADLRRPDRRPDGGPRHDPTSLAAVERRRRIGGAELRFRYGLAGGTPVGQYASLAVRHADAAPRHTIA